MADKSSIARGARNKGKSGEREAIVVLTSILKPVYDWHGAELDLARNLEQVRGGGADVIGLSWAAIEVKRREQLNLVSWFQQVKEASQPGQVPWLMWRQNRRPWRFRTLQNVASPGGPIGPLELDLELEQATTLLQWSAHYALAGC